MCEWFSESKLPFLTYCLVQYHHTSIILSIVNEIQKTVSNACHSNKNDKKIYNVSRKVPSLIFLFLFLTLTLFSSFSFHQQPLRWSLCEKKKTSMMGIILTAMTLYDLLYKMWFTFLRTWGRKIKVVWGGGELVWMYTHYYILKRYFCAAKKEKRKKEKL